MHHCVESDVLIRQTADKQMLHDALLCCVRKIEWLSLSVECLMRIIFSLLRLSGCRVLC